MATERKKEREKEGGCEKEKATQMNMRMDKSGHAFHIQPTEKATYRCRCPQKIHSQFFGQGDTCCPLATPSWLHWASLAPLRKIANYRVLFCDWTGFRHSSNIQWYCLYYFPPRKKKSHHIYNRYDMIASKRWKKWKAFDRAHCQVRTTHRAISNGHHTLQQ